MIEMMSIHPASRKYVLRVGSFIFHTDFYKDGRNYIERILEIDL